MPFVLVWSEGVDKQFEIFVDRVRADAAAVEHRRHGHEAYVVAGGIPSMPGGLDPANPDHLPGSFKV